MRWVIMGAGLMKSAANLMDYIWRGGLFGW